MFLGNFLVTIPSFPLIREGRRLTDRSFFN